MICKKCGRENEESSKFCSECGNPYFVSHGNQKVTAKADIPDATHPLSDVVSREEAPLEEVESVKAASEEGEGSLLDLSDFDFSPIDEEDTKDPIIYPGSKDFVPDTSGLDEFLVDPSYVPPSNSWKSGDTMEMPYITEDKKALQKEFRAPDPRQKKDAKRAKIAIGIIVVLILGALVAAALTYQFEMWGGKTIPEVTGLQKAAATELLEDKGFRVTTTDVVSDDVEGKVLLMEPSSGAREEEGFEVLLHVAAPRIVPEVVGKQQADAEKALADAGYTQIKIVTKKSNEKENIVLEVSPEAGGNALSTAEIVLTVAQSYSVPEVVGKDLDAATKALEKEGYKIWKNYVYSEEAEGTVLAMDPKAGTKLASGKTVTLDIAKSRSKELIAATWDYFDGRSEIKVDGITYRINSVDDVTYKSDDTTVCLITAAAVTVLDGEEVSGSQKQKSITLVWSDENEVVSLGSATN